MYVYIKTITLCVCLYMCMYLCVYKCTFVCMHTVYAYRICMCLFMVCGLTERTAYIGSSYKWFQNIKTCRRLHSKREKSFQRRFSSFLLPRNLKNVQGKQDRILEVNEFQQIFLNYLPLVLFVCTSILGVYLEYSYSFSFLTVPHTPTLTFCAQLRYPETNNTCYYSSFKFQSDKRECK